MKLSRRALLGLGLGATQIALLERFGAREARAAPATNAPTKLLSIWIPGGLHHELVWGALSPAGIAKYIPDPAGGKEPYFYNAAMVRNYDGSQGGDGAYQKFRGPIWWNPANPAADGGHDATAVNPDSGGAQLYVPWGYSWASGDLGNTPVYQRALAVHGIDQGTAAHGSGIIGSLCGVASSDFRAPAIAAVVANAMLNRFPDRPLPSICISGAPSPRALSTAANPMSGAANPILLSSIGSLEHMLSDHPDGAWAGLRKRHDIDEIGWDGNATGRKLPATHVDEAVLRATLGMKGRSSSGTDAALESLYESYGGLSRALAADVVATLSKTKGVEHLPASIPWAPNSGRFGYNIGYADGGSTNYWDSDFDLLLRLLKSDLATAITYRCSGANNMAFDTHDPPAHPGHVNNLRGTLEVLGRLFIEMSLTPSPSQAGKTLLDETLVHVFSDFGRTFAKHGSDHHPMTSVLMIGANVKGNRMIGGYDESIDGSPPGAPIDIIDIEQGTSTTKRPPRASDAAATVFRSFGLEAGKDFFIPGGYGEIAGVLT